MSRLAENPPTLDAAVLNDLAELERMRPGLLQTLIASFEPNRVRQLDELELAATTGDAARIRAIAHSLHGAAATLGMAALATAAAQIEAAPEQAIADPRAIAQLRNLTNDSVRQLRAWAASVR